MSDQFGGGSGYTPMPGEPPRGPVTQPAAPPSVINAVRLMFVRAGLGVLSLLVLLTTKDTLRKEIEKKNNYDATKLDNALNAAIAIGVVVGLIFILLYVLLALQVRKGKNWARIVTWVLAGLGVLSGIASLAQPQSTLSRVASLVSAALDLGVIILLAQRPSSQYFKRATY